MKYVKPIVRSMVPIAGLCNAGSGATGGQIECGSGDVVAFGDCSIGTNAYGDSASCNDGSAVGFVTEECADGSDNNGMCVVGTTL